MDLTNGKRGRSPGTSNSFAIIAFRNTRTLQLRRWRGSVASFFLSVMTRTACPTQSTPAPSGQCELEWSTRCFDLFRQGLGDQPTERGACGDASHATVLLLQGRQSRQSETMAPHHEEHPLGQTHRLHNTTIEEVLGHPNTPSTFHSCILPVLVTTPPLAHFADNEIQLQWRWWSEIQHLS